MTYTVITTFNHAGMVQYGQTMIDTFDLYWPASIPLIVYAEHCQPRITGDRVRVLDLMESNTDLARFKTKHANDPVANGQIAKDTRVPFKDNQFKWDAVRFSHKVFAVIHACTNLESDWIIWLDADTKTFAPVPDDFLTSICDPGAMACYLGRQEKYHSECGWVAYNRRHPDLRPFMDHWRDLYMTGDLFNLREYHDSFVFDILRKDFQVMRGTRFANISPSLPGKGPGHPFIASELGRYMDHMKGSKRKALGHSLPDDYDRNQGMNSQIGYWQEIFGR